MSARSIHRDTAANDRVLTVLKTKTGKEVMTKIVAGGNRMNRRIIGTGFGVLCLAWTIGCNSSDPIADDPSAPQDSVASQTGSNETGLNETPKVDGTEDRPLAEDRTSSASKLAKGDINFDDLKFDIEKGQSFEMDQLNDRVNSLNGKKVKLSGYILPSSVYRNEGIDNFVLVRDNQECCFGPGAALYDCVWVRMVDGNTASFSVRPVTVEGQFKIDTESYRYPGGEGPDGSSHLAVFEIEGVRVR